MKLDYKLSLMRSNGVADYVCAYIRLQFQWGLRIADLLRVDYSCINVDGTIIVQQGKGSKPLICFASSDYDYWQRVRAERLQPMLFFNYAYFYRLYKAYGLIMPSFEGGNSKVTHSARFQRAAVIMEATNDINLTATALGHKSTKSTEKYLPPSKRVIKSKGGILANQSGVISCVRVSKSGVLSALPTVSRKKSK
jgi:integrase